VRRGVRHACLVADSPFRRQPYAGLQHPNSMIHTAPPGADRRRAIMEIAAILMCAAVVLGFVQQLDNRSW